MEQESLDLEAVAGIIIGILIAVAVCLWIAPMLLVAGDVAVGVIIATFTVCRTPASPCPHVAPKDPAEGMDNKTAGYQKAA